MELLYGDEVVAEVTEIQPVKPEFEKACEKLAESMGAIRLRQMPIANNQHATMPGTGIRIHAGVPMTAKTQDYRSADIQDDENEGDPVTAECIGDATGKTQDPETPGPDKAHR